MHQTWICVGPSRLVADCVVIILVGQQGLKCSGMLLIVCITIGLTA